MLKNIADKYKEENNEELSMEKQDFPQARDILIHFNKNIYPEIEQKYHPEKWIIQETTGNKILQLFRLVKKENIINDSYSSDFFFDSFFAFLMSFLVWLVKNSSLNLL